MTALTEPAAPALNRDAILQSFLADAEADTQAVVEVTDLVQKCEKLRDELAATYGALVAAYGAAGKRPNVAAKLRELGIKNPASTKSEFGGPAARKRGSGRKASSRRAANDSSRRPDESPRNDEAGTASINE